MSYHEFEAEKLEYDETRDGVWVYDEGEPVVFLGRATLINAIRLLAEAENA